MRTDKTGEHRIRRGDLVRWDGDDELYTIARFLPGRGRNGTAAIVFEVAIGSLLTGALPDETSVTKVLS